MSTRMALGDHKPPLKLCISSNSWKSTGTVTHISLSSRDAWLHSSANTIPITFKALLPPYKRFMAFWAILSTDWKLTSQSENKTPRTSLVCVFSLSTLAIYLLLRGECSGYKIMHGQFYSGPLLYNTWHSHIYLNIRYTQRYTYRLTVDYTCCTYVGIYTYI